VNQYSDGIVSFTLYIAGVCEPEFYVRDNRQMMIIITTPTVVFNAREVIEQQGLRCGDQSNSRFYTSQQATMDTQRKQPIQETKTIPGNSIGGQVRKEYLVHTFNNDMHRYVGSMGSENPLTNEVNSGEDERGTFWYLLIAKPIIQEAVEVFRSAKPKSRSTQRREEDMDTEAAPSRGADPELLATMHACPRNLYSSNASWPATHRYFFAGSCRPTTAKPTGAA
jgi:hypothetical protein